MFTWFVFRRLRIFRQPDVSPGGHPSDERVPDRHEETQGPAKTAQGRQPALLTLDAVPARSIRDHGKSSLIQPGWSLILYTLSV
jgi:hypothetical protein